MAITYDEASAQAEALKAAGDASPIRQTRYDLLRQARDWQRAARQLVSKNPETGALDPEPDLVIELVGSIVPGMLVPEIDGWCMVRRSFQQGTGWSLHLDDERNPAGRYLNFAGPGSPVVVKR